MDRKKIDESHCFYINTHADDSNENPRKFSNSPMYGGFSTGFYWKLSTWENVDYIGKYYLDTSINENLIHKSVALKVGATKIVPQDKQGNDRISMGFQSLGTIWIHLAIGELSLPIKFYVVDTLEVPAKVGYKFVKEHVDSIHKNFEETTFKLERTRKYNVAYDLVSRDLLEYCNKHKYEKDIAVILDQMNDDYEFESDTDSNSSVITESEQSAGLIYLSKDNERVTDESGRLEIFETPQIPLWNPHMDGLENIDFSRDEKDEYLKVYSFEDFSRNFAKYDPEKVKFSDKILQKHEVDGTFVIANSRSVYKELNDLVDLPYGLKQHLNGRIFSIPQEKLWGLIMNGTRKSEHDSEVLREGLIDGFHNCPEFVLSAKTIQIVSYRKLMDILGLNILRYIAYKFNKTLILYAPDEENNGGYFYDEKLDKYNKELGMVFLAQPNSEPPAKGDNSTADNVSSPQTFSEQMIFTNDKFFVELPTANSCKNKIKFLIDTGSSINLLNYDMTY